MTIAKVRATRHNGRAGKNGVYTTKHNDRNFDVSHADHIDPERTRLNVYWDWENGRRSGEKSVFECEDGSVPSFDDAEKHFYEIQYADYVAGQNARNASRRHSERNRTAEEIRHDKRFCPEETIYQFGREGNGATAEELTAIVQEFLEVFQHQYGSRIHVLDWALHVDETTVHIQERHCFDYINAYGEVEPKQEKALEALGIPLPDPNKAQGRYNNRKITFDAMNRLMLIEIAKKHGLDIEENVKYGGKQHREKMDFVIAKQLEMLAEQGIQLQKQDAQIAALTTSIAEKDAQLQQTEEKLDAATVQLKDINLTLEIEREELNEVKEKLAEKNAEIAARELELTDVEAVLDQAVDIAYEKSVEAVVATVSGEVKRQSVATIEHAITEAAVQTGLTAKERSTVTKLLGKVKDELQTLVGSVVRAIKDKLLLPTISKKAKAQIRERAKPAVMDLLDPWVKKTNRRNDNER